MSHERRILRRAAALVAVLVTSLLVADAAREAKAQDGATASPIKSRHMETPRSRATPYPRSEGDQAVVEGWPLYRTERGQTAFNDAMAALKATDGRAPAASAFRGCANLDCHLTLPAIGSDGWLPAGRLWVSPSQYVLIAHSPRNREGRSYRRRPTMGMRVFVFHEFHNSSRNIDLYDTISSHKSSVFVPLYMSKPARDAQGREFVTIVQVAPYDVVSIHATSHGSAGPGIEVAKNASDPLDQLQALAGVVVATMAKEATPRLRVVNHGGNEGLPMLMAYERRLQALQGRPSSASIRLPFVPALPQRMAAATARLDELILRPGMSPRIPVAERALIPRVATASMLGGGGKEIAAPVAARDPALVEPIRLVVRSRHASQ